MAAPEHYDIVIVGAGITGLNTAYRLRQHLPDLSIAILEASTELGGTWRFWKYPGARSDSALATFGFAWHPWPHDVDFGSAPDIKAYIDDAARVHDLNRYVRRGHRVVQSAWASEEQAWTVDVDVRVDMAGSESGSENQDEEDARDHDAANVVRKQFKCWWLVSCSGYYSYTQALETTIPGLDRFQGQTVHPQWWTDDVDYTGKKVVIIGSGATAVTLLPSLAQKARHTTMLQRSPSYVLSIPRRDALSSLLFRWFPHSWLAASFDWWRHLAIERIFVALCETVPNFVRWVLLRQARQELPPGYPVDVHFNPRYDPFDQRLCFAPDGDFFAALRDPDDRAEVVTDTIDTVTKTGIRLASGRVIDDVDLIVTATGLHVQLLNGLAPVVDGQPMVPGERFVWRSIMMDGVPNACSIMGYVKGVWTPGVDARARILIAILKHMRLIGASAALPYMTPEERAAAPRGMPVNVSSTYFLRAEKNLPISTGSWPWYNGQNWLEDMWSVWWGGLWTGMKYTYRTQGESKKTA